jgi:hypothetical protein
MMCDPTLKKLKAHRQELQEQKRREMEAGEG